MATEQSASEFRPNIPVTAITVFYLCFITFAAQFIAADYKESIASILAGYNSQFGITDIVPPLVRHDSQWYINIARHGYTSTTFNNAHNAGFLPFYPFMVWLVSRIISINTIAAGLLASWISAVIAMNALYAYYKNLSGEKDAAFKTIVALVTFPVGFLFASLYSESTFLALIALTFLFYQQKRYLPAAAMGFLASATRLTGLTLVPVFLFHMWLEWRSTKRVSRSAMLLVAAPLLAFFLQMAYFQITFDDPLKYFHEKQAWFGLSEHHWPWDTISNSAVQAYDTWQSIHIHSINNLLEIPSLLFAILGTFFLWRRKMTMEAVFVASNIALILSSGSLWGVARFTVVLFPIFYILAASLPKWAWYSYLIAALFLQTIALLIFVTMSSVAL